jgi:hypothetical protein
MNSGNGRFETRLGLPGSRQPTKSIVVADVDGDGDIDIIIGNGNRDEGLSSSSRLHDNDNVNQLLINRGDGTFDVAGSSFPGGSAVTFSVTAADVDGDGDVDIIVGNMDQANELLINAGDGTFATSDSFPGGTTALTFSVAAADVDGDGDVDIIVGNGELSDAAGNAAVNELLINNQDVVFVADTSFPGASKYTTIVAAADIDGDGDLDIILSKESTDEEYGGSQLLINRGDGTFFAGGGSALSEGDTDTRALAVVDVDGDGYVDIINARNELQINVGDGTFVTSTVLPGVDSESVLAADVDGDGDMDIITGNTLLLNDGKGSFVQASSSGLDRMDHICRVAADVDGDGDVDLVVGFLLFLNSGDGSFSSGLELPTRVIDGEDATTDNCIVVAADVDGDGDVDMVVGTGTQSS